MCQILPVPPEAAMPRGRGSGPQAPPLWVWLWGEQERVGLVPGVNSGSGSLGEGCSPAETLGTEESYHLGSKGRTGVGLGGQEAAFVATTE